MDAYHSPYRLIVDTHPLLSTNNGSKSYNIYSDEANFNEANFDTNMVIILAALLCALICALMLNSIVRCFLRCQRRFVFESAESAAARQLATTGLKKSALVQIPVAVYGSSIDVRATDCPICLGEFVEGERVRLLPRCNHGFHMMCIDTWLASHSSCPTCRQSLLEQPIMTSSDSGDVEAGFRQPGIA